MQEKDYKWFLDNYDNLFEDYGHKYLAIKNQTVLGAYSSYADAVEYYKTKDPYGLQLIEHEVDRLLGKISD